MTRHSAMLAPIDRSKVPVINGTRNASASMHTITFSVSTNSMLPFHDR